MAPTPETVWADAGVALAPNATRAITTVTNVRRMPLILALLVGAAVVTPAAPAAAHAIVSPNQIPLNTLVSVSFQVVADLPVVMTEIEITPPPSFKVASAGQVPGWQVAFTPPPTKVQLKGRADSGSFIVVTLNGTATAKGVLRFGLVEIGETARRSNTPKPGPVASPHRQCSPASRSSRPTTATTTGSRPAQR